MTNQIEVRHPIPPAPVHPLAALITIILDNVFGVFEIIDPLFILLTSLLVGTIGGVSVTLIQRFLAKDEWGPAVAKGVAMGVIAGVPFQVAGTAVGVPLLAWAGLHQWIKRPILPAESPVNEGASENKGGEEGEIVDGEVREIND